MTKRDYYEVLGVSKNATENKKGIQENCHKISSGQESRKQRG